MHTTKSNSFPRLFFHLEIWSSNFQLEMWCQKSKLEKSFIDPIWIFDITFPIGNLTIKFPSEKKVLEMSCFFLVCIAYRVWWIYLLKHILTSVENEALTRLIMQLQRWDQAFRKAKNLLIHLISTDLTNSLRNIS